MIEPNRRIVEGVRARLPEAPIIGFPRGAAGLLPPMSKRGVNVVGLDYAMPVGFADTNLPKALGVQGNLDPLRLVVGGAPMEERARADHCRLCRAAAYLQSWARHRA